MRSAVILVFVSWNLALAQSYSLITLHDFAGTDGQDPDTLVQASDGSLFGATALGGAGNGTVFQLKTDGQIITLHQFSGSDGVSPNSLVQVGDTLYGTALEGGNTACPSGCGTVFRIDPKGQFSTLYAFSGPDGEYPANRLLGLDGNLYGTTGENAGTEVVFKLTPGGSLSPLYTFCTAPNCPTLYSAGPDSLVQEPNGDFLVLTLAGGSVNGGAISELTPAGALTVLLSIYSYEMGDNPRNLSMTSNGDLYFTVDSDPYGSGRVLKFDSQAVKLVYQFDYTNGEPPYFMRTGRDGNIYGAVANGGSDFSGAVFEVSGASSDFIWLYNLPGSYEGAAPNSVRLGSDGNLYGTTAGGGLPLGACVNCGTVFELQKSGPQSPAITGFVPNSSPPGAQVALAGTNFTGTTSVQFGKASAEFTVVSDTRINAEVPAGATMYPLTVTTPNGSAMSVPPFEIGPPLTTIYAFCPNGPFPNCPDGVTPNSLIMAADGNLYGTTDFNTIESTVFQLTPSGAITTLASNLYYPNQLFQAGNGNIYGTTYEGGYFKAPTVCNTEPETASGCGSIFRISPSGTYTELYAFKELEDGGYPTAGLVEGSDGALYGTTSTAGAGGWGTVYRWSNGELQTLYSFNGTDGSAPTILLAAKNGILYGITASGGSSGKGTVFAFSVTVGLTTLYSFTGEADGGNPTSLILMADGKLYGATANGGGAGGGTIFQLTTAGALTTLYSFSSSTSGSGPANLIAAGGRLFGTAGGGPFGGGGVFELTPAGEFLPLYAFFSSLTASFGGYGPSGLVRAPDGSFYGTTAAGGTLSCQYGQGCGTVYHLTGVQ